MKKIIIVALFLICSGCKSNVSGDWTCPLPAVNGKPCQSISEADVAKNSHDIEEKDSRKVEIFTLASPLPEQNSLNAEDDVQTVKDISSKFRVSEKLARVWFAPYIDNLDNRHASSHVFFVYEPGKWAVQ